MRYHPLWKEFVSGMSGSKRGMIDLVALFSLCWRNRWVVGVSILVGLAVSAVALWVVDPTYRAVTTLMVVRVEGSSLDYNMLLLNRNLAKTYAEVARSRSAAEQVVKQLDLKVTPEELRERVSVVTVRETELILISVEYPIPDQAANIANSLAVVVRKQIQEYMQTDNIRVVDAAAIPVSPTSPKPLPVIALGFLLGLSAGVGLAVVGERW
jgi:capsular polysaccharide biosynthesis protein